MSNQIVISSGAKVRNLSGVLTGTAGIVNALGINVPSGIPQLDGSGKILVSQLPNSVMEYKGTWNAATNTPTLANGTGNQGDVYLVSVAGTVNFGAGPITFAVGDQVIYSGTIWQKAGGSTGTVTSVAVTETGDALTITGSPITTSGTINIGFAGTSGQYVNGAGGLTTFPSLTGFVPYTGATANVDLGTFDLTTDIVNANDIKALTSAGLDIYSNSGTHIALMGGGGGAGTTFYGGIVGTTGSFASSGGSDTFAINHSSGSGIALNITKGGNGEGLYINKTSGSGNAVTIIGTLNATTLVKSGGTSSQFLKADGSVDSTTYQSALTLTTTGTSGVATLVGATLNIPNYSPDLSNYVTLNGIQTITGEKTFANNTLKLAATGSGGLVTFLSNISGTGLTSSGSNAFGFNINNDIYFAGSDKVGGVFVFNNTAVRNYTLQNASGTLAFTSDLGAYLPLAGGTLSGALNVNVNSGTGLNVATENVVFRASPTYGFPRQLVFSMGSGPTTTLEAKGYGGNYITDFNIRTYNSAGTGFDVFFGTANGDVGIGNNSPAAKLDVNGSIKGTGLSLVTAGSTSALIQSSGTNVYTSLSLLNTTTGYGYDIGFGGSASIAPNSFYIYGGSSASVKLLINPSGNVGIGTSSPLYKTHIVNSGSNAFLGISNQGSANGDRQLIMGFGGNGSETFATIKGTRYNVADDVNIAILGGNVGIGTTSPNRPLVVSASIAGSVAEVQNSRNNSSGDFCFVTALGSNAANTNSYHYIASTGGSDRCYIFGNGNIVNTNNSYGPLSDIKLKENITDATPKLDKLMQVRIVNYNLKSDLGYDSNKQIGVVAQELEQIFPALIDEHIDRDSKGNDLGTTTKSVKMSVFVPMLIKAIQEQQAQIEELKQLILNK